MRKRLRQLRQGKGITQTFLAKKLGYKNSSGYSNIEYGTNRLSYEQAKIIAEVLGVAITDLDEETDKKFDSNLHNECKKPA